VFPGIILVFDIDFEIQSEKRGGGQTESAASRTLPPSTFSPTP